MSAVLSSEFPQPANGLWRRFFLAARRVDYFDRQPCMLLL
jgi:hypothetical protein